MHDLQSKDVLEGVEVAIAVEQRMRVLEAERGDEAIDSLPDLLARRTDDGPVDVSSTDGFAEAHLFAFLPAANELAKNFLLAHGEVSAVRPYDEELASSGVLNNSRTLPHGDLIDRSALRNQEDVSCRLTELR